MSVVSFLVLVSKCRYLNLGASGRLQVAIDVLDFFALGEALGARVMVRVSLPSAWRSSPMFFSPSVQSLVVFEGAPHQ